jgi:1-acyl-sn-glycerol-3-phosphate acyltransferase
MADAPAVRSEAAQTDTDEMRRNVLVEVEPHRWALSWWARLYRRIAKPWILSRHVRNFCRPLTVDGREHLEGLTGPLLIIANHSSHFDTAIVLDTLPRHVYLRTAVVAAADRMYRERIKGMWNSLRYNSFPITRGGGREALAYSQWLLSHGWSLLIFPEGKRSRDGELMPHHGGPAILALSQDVPVLPMYIHGAIDILPPGTRRSRPAPVHLRIGPLLRIPRGTNIADAKRMMEDSIRDLANGDQTAKAA